jgi:hypothetical protein
MNKTIKTTILSAVITASTFSLPVQAATGVIDKVLNKVEKANVQNTKILSGNNDIKADLQILSSTQYAQISETIEIRDILEPQFTPRGFREFVSSTARTLEIVLETIPREEVAEFLGITFVPLQDPTGGSISLQPASKDMDGCNQGTQCGNFKEDLLQITDDLEVIVKESVDEITTEGAEFNTDAHTPLDLSVLKTLLSKVPGKVLFPAFKITSSSDARNQNGGLRQRISNLRTKIEDRRAERQARRDSRKEPRQIEDGTTPEEYPYEYYKKIDCEGVLTKHPFALANYISGVAYLMKGIGKGLLAAGDTYLQIVDPKANAGGSLGPEVVGKIDGNHTKTLGEIYDGAGDAFISIASSKRNKIRHCVVLRAQLNIWNKLNGN